MARFSGRRSSRRGYARAGNAAPVAVAVAVAALGGGRRRSAPAGSRRSQAGQASVEAVALLPVLALAALVAWQLLLAGHTLWLSAHAARAAARADAVGERPARAARSALPKSLERSLVVDRPGGRAVRVRLRVPILLPAWDGPVRVSATSSLGGSQ